MSYARTQHPNAVLTPEGRRRLVGCVLDRGWSVEATAERFQVDAKTVRKWRDRFMAEGEAGLFDRSSRPHRCPNRTGADKRAEVLRLRRERRWGADHIGHETGLAASTVQSILRSAGLGRLDRGDRATKEPVWRYQRDQPGELIHVDVKKIAAIPNGAAGEATAAATTRPKAIAEPATATSTPPSTTGLAWRTRRFKTTNAPTPPLRSGHEPPPGSRSKGSPVSG